MNTASARREVLYEQPGSPGAAAEVMWVRNSVVLQDLKL
jgi:hypothetical protein